MTYPPYIHAPADVDADGDTVGDSPSAEGSRTVMRDEKGGTTHDTEENV